MENVNVHRFGATTCALPRKEEKRSQRQQRGPRTPSFPVVFGRGSFRLSKEIRLLEGQVASAQRALKESPYTVESLLAEAEATRRLQLGRARGGSRLAKLEEDAETGDKEAASAAATADGATWKEAPAEVAMPKEGVAEAAAGLDGAAAAPGTSETAREQEEREVVMVEVEEGLGVEGGFDPTPELKSRFADKSSSLRFVTAEEDARMRKEELAKVFAARNQATDGDEEEPSSSVAAERGPSEEGGSNGEEEQGQGNIPADSAGEGQGDASFVGGKSKVGMKAFRAKLESTLSQSLLGRVPPSVSAAAGATARVGGAGGGKVRVPISPPRRQQQQREQPETKAAAILTPPYKNKSKFFRSVESPPGASHTASSGPLVPPPPKPMMGLLSQIRARGGGGGGGAGSGSSSAGDVKAGMGGLLAQIRAAKGGRGSSSGDSGTDGEEGSSSAQGKGEDSGVAPPPLPQAPAPPLSARSLFPAAGSSTATATAPQGPPPDFLAQLRAKAAEKQALRLAAAAESND